MVIQQHLTFASPQKARGYHALYRAQEVNHCPGCGGTHWIIGRVSAECARCATALPLAESAPVSNGRWEPAHSHAA